MKALLRLVALTFATALLATVAALIVERAQPDAAGIPGLGLCGGVPCFSGIVLGETSIEQAKQHILLLFGQSPNHFGYYLGYDLNSSTELSIWCRCSFYSLDATVQDIKVNSLAGANLTTLGQLVAVLGTPRTIGWDNDGDVIICFPGLCVANFRDNYLPITPDLPITTMELSSLPLLSTTANQPWHGFGTYTPYTP